MTDTRTPIPGQEAGLAATDVAGLGDIRASLAGLRSRARLLLVVRALALLGGAFLLCLIAAACIDYFLRLPAWLRTGVLAAGVAGVVYGVRRWLAPAWLFRPALTEVALRVERSRRGVEAGLTGLLASGLELASQDESGMQPMALLGRKVSAEAARRFSGFAAGRLLHPSVTRRGLLVLTLGAALGAGAWAWRPSLAAIGAARVLAPWSGAQWPKRTEVADVTGTAVHPLGTALALRAALTRSDQPVGEARVSAHYRVVEDGKFGPVRSVLLTGQKRNVGVPGDEVGGAVRGELYERLVEPAALGVGDTEGSVPGPARAEVEYWFETEDDRTEPRRVLVVEPPAVSSAAATVTPPAYAGSPEGSPFVSGERDLGAGADQRAVVGPVLAGSGVEVRVTLNKPVPGPAAGDEGGRAWLATALPGVDPASIGADITSSVSGREWTVRWTAASSARLPVSVKDEHGLSGTEESVFTFEVVPDHAPSATVTEPREDETVLPTAKVEVTGEGRDDVGLRTLALERRHARAVKGSIGAAPEPSGDPEAFAQRGAAEPGAPAPTRATLAGALDLSLLKAAPGDEVWITVLASDTFDVAGATHEPVRSSPRRLRIISEQELVEQVRSELSAIRQSAMRLDEEQAQLAAAPARGDVTADERSRQGGVGQRLRRNEEQSRRLAERVRRNGLEDPGLESVLADVGELLGGAAESSEAASATLDEASRRAPEDKERAPLDAEQARAAAGAQAAVREQLGRLVEMLDRGEDGWVVRRQLQQLLDQQKVLKATTDEADRRLSGKPSDQLSAQERAEVRELAERQARLADQANSALDELDERSRQLKDSDPAQSAGMNQAAQRGRQEQVPQKLRDAAESIAQNQTSSASASQQKSIDAMQKMLEDLDKTERARDEALRRLLANLMDSLKALIASQEGEIAALARAKEGGVLGGLGDGMIALNRNTVALAVQVKSGQRDAAPIGETIDKAGKAQEGAIGVLRGAHPDADKVDDHERESLRLLRAALAEAEKLGKDAQDRNDARQRAELRKFYREMLEQQVALRGETGEFVGKKAERREQHKIRGIGQRQETLREKLSEQATRSEAITQTATFAFAHQRLDTVTASASKRLRTGEASPRVALDQDSAVKLLASLVESLRDDPKKDFRDGEAGGGGGGGGGGQGGQKPPAIPPLAELRLLRGMQGEAADLTKAIDDARGGASPADLEELGQLQRDLATHADELLKKLQPPKAPDAPAKEGDK